MTKTLALAALALVFLLGAAFQSSGPDSFTILRAIQSGFSDLKAQNDSLAAQVASLANKGPRKFYLTQTNHNGAQALSACAGGYHMASLWEIHEPSNLRYNTELGFTRSDSGFGPPTGADGWIRTGTGAFISGPPGVANCDAWTSASGPDTGTIAALIAPWNAPAVSVDPWSAPGAATCAALFPVWCVQD